MNQGSSRYTWSRNTKSRGEVRKRVHRVEQSTRRRTDRKQQRVRTSTTSAIVASCNWPKMSFNVNAGSPSKCKKILLIPRLTTETPLPGGRAEERLLIGSCRAPHARCEKPRRRLWKYRAVAILRLLILCHSLAHLNWSYHTSILFDSGHTCHYELRRRSWMEPELPTRSSSLPTRISTAATTPWWRIQH